MVAESSSVSIFVDLFSALSIYGLLTKREVKMAGYWPSSFILSFACFKHVLKERGQHSQPSLLSKPRQKRIYYVENRTLFS